MAVWPGEYETVAVPIWHNSSSIFLACSFNLINSSATLGVAALACASVAAQACASAAALACVSAAALACASAAALACASAALLACASSAAFCAATFSAAALAAACYTYVIKVPMHIYNKRQCSSLLYICYICRYIYIHILQTNIYWHMICTCIYIPVPQQPVLQQLWPVPLQQPVIIYVCR
jgi:hypothetical protein